MIFVGANSMEMAMQRLSGHLYRKSVGAIAALELRFGRVLLAWTIIAALMCGLRVAFAVTPITDAATLLQTILPYVLVISAPIAAYMLCDSIFRHGALYEQPQIRLSRYGKWQPVNCLTARQHRLFGPTGMMASLVIGMLLNVPVRSIEFLTAVPAMNGNAPLWGQALFAAMTADVVVMNFLYVVAFMMALRNVPWFPRLLLVVWVIDISSQLAIAQWVGGFEGLPQGVGEAMSGLLQGNIKKVMISMVIWLPYLILSERVNLTYRSRVAR
jgi:hypothetical protein